MADTSGIMVHNFSECLLDNMVHFHVMKMKDSLFVWMGKKAELSSLSVAMCTKYSSTPAVSNLLGEVSDITSNTLAQRLAKKLKKQCFISYNLPPENTLLTLAERRLVEEIDSKPNYF